MRKYCLWLMLAPALMLAPIRLSAQVEINAMLMESTFKIVGPARLHPGKENLGTVFMVGKPSATIPGRLYVIMLTAHHVLNDMAGETTTLVGRTWDSSGLWHRTNVPITIR